MAGRRLENGRFEDARVIAFANFASVQIRPESSRTLLTAPELRTPVTTAPRTTARVRLVAVEALPAAVRQRPARGRRLGGRPITGRQKWGIVTDAYLSTAGWMEDVLRGGALGVAWFLRFSVVLLLNIVISTIFIITIITQTPTHGASGAIPGVPPFA